MIHFETKYNVGDKVSHSSHGEGEIKEINGKFSCRETTCSLDLFYLVDFCGNTLQERESSLVAQRLSCGDRATERAENNPVILAVAPQTIGYKL